MLHGIRRHIITSSLRLIRSGHKAYGAVLERKYSNRLTFSTQPETKVIFSGIQSTGVPHLGNYLGALIQWVDLQTRAVEGDRLFYSIVDLHAITVPQDAQQLRKWRRETLAVLLAVGLNPERCAIFYQSAVPEHTELMWILSCMAPMGALSRMTQWKVGILRWSLLDESKDPGVLTASRASLLSPMTHPLLTLLPQGQNFA